MPVKSLIRFALPLFIASTMAAQTGKIVLPLEVLGYDGAEQTVSVPLGLKADIRSPKLWIRIHALVSTEMAAVRWNQGEYIPLQEENVTIGYPAVNHGGIGGGMRTIDLTMRIPLTDLVDGDNSLTFRFNQFNRSNTIGYRVLQLNVLDGDRNLLPPDMFVEDDPLSWGGPSTTEEDITEGEWLWRNAELRVPSRSEPLRAKCGDCHARDGRDLQYFNYSNRAIQERARFHGLTIEQADKITSYIRSLKVPRPGRPWNPPYQPGPGLDDKPVSEWSAGAGLGFVLPTDLDIAQYLFPDGVQSAIFSPNSELNVRQTPIPVQLPDWNRWLPEVHPVDVLGDEFLKSQYYTKYLALQKTLRKGDATAYASAYLTFLEWTIGRDRFMALVRPSNSAPLSDWNDQKAHNAHGSSLWQVVKMWELNQEFELEGLNRSVFKHPRAAVRGWVGGTLFRTSPTLLAIPEALFLNGNPATKIYLTFSWYHLQLITNDSNHEQQGGSPIDWPYAFGSAMSLCTKSNVPSPLTYMIWQIRALQISENGEGPERPLFGWNWNINDPSRLVSSTNNCWATISATDRVQINEAFLRAWLTKIKTFTPQQLYASGISPNEPTNLRSGGPAFADRVSFMIPQFRAIGVSPTLIQEMAAWAKTVWPTADWDKIADASCILDSSRNEYKCRM